ncbi:hypothetical protein U9M48_027680 [Paspalum notatum var. saurae]|uniref:Uncharacterized protein n=1 Tax=Paspalum notatum var. saurae TaxID=547442 RepID=A0AAQ3TV82_PASNO
MRFATGSMGGVDGTSPTVTGRMGGVKLDYSFVEDTGYDSSAGSRCPPAAATSSTASAVGQATSGMARPSAAECSVCGGSTLSGSAAVPVTPPSAPPQPYRASAWASNVQHGAAGAQRRDAAAGVASPGSGRRSLAREPFAMSGLEQAPAVVGAVVNLGGRRTQSVHACRQRPDSSMAVDKKQLQPCFGCRCAPCCKRDVLLHIPDDGFELKNPSMVCVGVSSPIQI